MLGVIINEQKVLDELLNNHKMIENTSNCINILIKHYWLQNHDIDKLELLYTILEDIKKCDLPKFSVKKCEESIQGRIDNFYKELRKYGEQSVKIKVIDKIVITKAEIALIESYDDKKTQQVMFILLVYAKITNKLNNNESYWLNQSITNIMKEAKVSNGQKKTDILYNLKQTSAITNTVKVNGKGIKVNYAYEDSEEGLVIENFDGVIYQWLKYKGERWKRCSECGKWIKIKSKTCAPKYCKECKKIVDKETKKRYYYNKKGDD